MAHIFGNRYTQCRSYQPFYGVHLAAADPDVQPVGTPKFLSWSSEKVSIDAAQPVTVFIAEDNPILLQGLERALVANGCEVRTAIDGAAMLELIERLPLPDILLLDVMMPVLSGIDVLQTVRSNPRTTHLPVMFITAAAEEVVPRTVMESENVEVLMKPFRLSELLSRLTAQVGRARAIRPVESTASGAPPTSAVSK